MRAHAHTTKALLVPTLLAWLTQHAPERAESVPSSVWHRPSSLITRSTTGPVSILVSASTADANPRSFCTMRSTGGRVSSNAACFARPHREGVVIGRTDAGEVRLRLALLCNARSESLSRSRCVGKRGSVCQQDSSNRPIYPSHDCSNP